MEKVKNARVPLLRCGVGACLHIDREGDKILIYQSDEPTKVVELTIEEYNAWLEAAEPIR